MIEPDVGGVNCRPSNQAVRPLYVAYRTTRLKGTVSRDFRYVKKTPPGPHMNRRKQFFLMLRFREDIRKKSVST